MTVNTVNNKTYTTASPTQKTYIAADFAKAMEQARQASAVAQTDTATRAADVRAGLDAETLAHLEKYEEIYNKYAAQYGNGFEAVGTMVNGNDAAAVAESLKYDAIRDAFRNELYEAGIPGEMALKHVMAEDLANIDITELANNLRVAEPSYVSTLFYAEKYGLAGLSKEEQYKAVLGGLNNSSSEAFCGALSLLSKVGAISANDAFTLQSKARLGMVFEGETDWNAMLKELTGDESLRDVCEMLLKALESGKDNAEGEKLKAIYKKVDDYQDAIHESIEQSNKRRRELELLDRAAAESARLQALFGLVSMSDADTLGLSVADAAVGVV